MRIVIFTLVVAGGVALLAGCSGAAPGSPAEASRAAERGTGGAAGEAFGEANWNLDAGPAAVPSRQRIDPATGRPYELSDAQAAASDDDGRSPLERSFEQDGAPAGAETGPGSGTWGVR